MREQTIRHRNNAARRRLRCAILVERRYLSQAQPGGLIASLRGRGHDAIVIDPESLALEAGEKGWLAGVDLAVARGRSWPVLTMLGWAEASGVPTINRRRAVTAVLNKADMSLRLSAANLPVPLTYFGSIRQLAERFRPRDYPVILKPVFGDNGRGLLMVNNKQNLIGTDWPEPVALAQRFIENLGWDLKLYCMGPDVWAVRKPAPWSQSAERPARVSQPELVDVKPLWRKLARRCGKVFGLDLFGVDCVETDAGLVIIEVNEFPNYSGIPSANEKLAEYVLGRIRQERTP